MSTPNIPSRAMIIALAALGTIASARPALAQHPEHAHADSMAGMPSMQGETDAAMAESMSDMKMRPHMRMTAMRVPNAADIARARAVADTLRRAIAKYKDVRVAEADGYRMFAPRVKKQRVYHFTRKLAAVKAQFTFDPTTPTSLLYTRDAAGVFTLVGAMYTAPLRSSEEDLNARVPLSIAHWHEHVNICLPKRGDEDRFTEKRNGRFIFGPGGAISTKEDCDANGGRFREHLFNWMVHANVYAGEDLATVWGDHH